MQTIAQDNSFVGTILTSHAGSRRRLCHVLFPTYVAALLWGGLILRDARLRSFLPIRRES